MLENPSYTIKTCQMKKLVKVVAFGSSGSGKTTLIKRMDPSHAEHRVPKRHGDDSGV